MLDWLKVLVSDKQKAPTKKAAPADDSHIKIDSRTYPLVKLTKQGFLAGEFDQSLAVGQGVSLSVVVNDRWGKFNFNARCTIAATDDKRQFSGSFAILAPEIEQVLVKYAKNRSAK